MPTGQGSNPITDKQRHRKNTAGEVLLNQQCLFPAAGESCI